MVLYFSSTGNTEFAAKRIAEATGDTCVNLLDRIRKNDHSELHSDTPFIICAPVYVCEMPRFLRKYIKEQTFTGSKEVSFVFTSGGYCGVAGKLAKNLMKRKGMIWRGHADITMPRNYIVSEHYPMLDEAAVKERIESSCKQLDTVIDDLKAGRDLTARKPSVFELWVTVPLNPVWSKFMYKTKGFHATDTCIGCGKCVKLCPLNNILFKDKKPVWENNCSHCMACIGNCPVEAIQYSNITQNKDKYHFGKYSHFAKK